MAPKPIYKEAERTTVVMEKATYQQACKVAAQGHGGFSRWAARQIDMGLALDGIEWDPELYRWTAAQAEKLGMSLPQFLTTILKHSLQQAYQHVQKQQEQECLASQS